MLHRLPVRSWIIFIIHEMCGPLPVESSVYSSRGSPSSSWTDASLAALDDIAYKYISEPTGSQDDRLSSWRHPWFLLRIRQHFHPTNHDEAIEFKVHFSPSWPERRLLRMSLQPRTEFGTVRWAQHAREIKRGHFT